MQKRGNSWVSPKHLTITVYAGILFLACACVNAGMTNTILPRICQLRGWEYADVLPFMSYGGTAMVTLGLGTGILMSIQRHRKLVQT